MAANIAVFLVKECIVFLKYITKPEPVALSAAGSGLLFAVFVSLFQVILPLSSVSETET